MKNLVKAEKYFKYSLNKGDLLSGYNLARLIRMRTPSDNKGILKYLKIAAEHKDKDYAVMYMLGLEFFGNNDEKKIAIDYFENNKATRFGLSNEFKLHFGLNTSN